MSDEYPRPAEITHSAEARDAGWGSAQERLSTATRAAKVLIHEHTERQRERDAALDRAEAAERQSAELAAALEDRKACKRCKGTGLVDDGRHRIYYETDSPDECGLTDSWHRIKCPDCSKDPAAILSAHDAALTAPLQQKINDLTAALKNYVSVEKIKAGDTFKARGFTGKTELYVCTGYKLAVVGTLPDGSNDVREHKVLGYGPNGVEEFDIWEPCKVVTPAEIAASLSVQYTEEALAKAEKQRDDLAMALEEIRCNHRDILLRQQPDAKSDRIVRQTLDEFITPLFGVDETRASILNARLASERMPLEVEVERMKAALEELVANDHVDSWIAERIGVILAASKGESI